ncbi:MAG: efflux RND transporter permease subunit [Bacteroidota bacterium]|nr:efflux RND transporter permease subunit [Bacteroidota bacterium]
MSIVEISLKRPLLIVVVFTLLVMGGVVSYNMLNLNLLPKFELSTFTVQTIYPGAGASEVETSVTKKIEDALSSVENLKKISSKSMEGISIVTVQLTDGANSDQAVQEAQRKINAIRSDLPVEVLEPSIEKMALDEKAILNLAASSSLPATQFYTLIKDRIQPRLAKLQGVGAVRMNGGTEREIKVNIDIQKLKAYNLSIVQVVQAIQAANKEFPTGNIENTRSTYSVRLAAKYVNLDELRNTNLKTSDKGEQIKVSDVAEVQDGIADQTLINRINNKEAIGVSVMKQSDANAVNVANLVKKELTTIEKEYAADHIHFEVAFDDSVYTKASASSVIEDLILAILIVSIICFVFLHDLRSAAIIMVAIPLSIIPAFILIYALGFSLNMMSLIALSLVVGILVDDSIVVVENMFHHLEQGKSKWKAARDGSMQIMFTCMAITLVIVVVFLPMAISGGMIGNILNEFAVPIIVTVLCSLLVSFTVTPLLMSRFGKISKDKHQPMSLRFASIVEKSFETIKLYYSRLLEISLTHKKTVLLLAFGLLIGSFSLLPAGFIGFSFMPDIDKGEFTVMLDMNPQVTLYQNNQISMKVEKVINNHPEVKCIYTNVGQSSSGGAKNNETTITVKLIDKKERSVGVEECAQSVKTEIIQSIPGVRVQTIVASLSGTTSKPVQYTVQGSDMSKVQQTADKILNTIRHTPGTADVKFSVDDSRQELRIKLDRDKMAKLGLSATDVGSALRVALAGNDDAKYSEGNYEYKIRIEADDFDRTKADNVAQLTVQNNKGELIELNQFADIRYQQGPSALERTDRISSITVESNVVGRPIGTVGAEISAAIKDKVPDGVTVKEGGMLEFQSAASGSLGIAFLSAIIMIYLIMVVLYDSLTDPLIVMVSIPLALIGAFLALALTMNNLTIFSVIGLIVLIGLVAKNAILLVDFANHLQRNEKMDIHNALIEAGNERLRPILMTTFAMIFGMLPIALAAGQGAEMKNGMAWVIIGGLTSSMLLTLVVVPVVYYLVHRLIYKYNRIKRNKLIEKVQLRIDQTQPL